MSAPYGSDRLQPGQPYPPRPPQPPQPYGHLQQPGSEPELSTEPMQRPVMLTLSVVLIIAGSMLLMTQLALVWLFVYIARDPLGYSGTDGVFYHMLEEFHLRMLQGLALVGFGFPGAAVVLSFFLLLRKSWPRIAITLLGALSIVAAAVVLSDHVAWVLPAGVYIAFAVVMLWTPAVSEWSKGRQSVNATSRWSQ